VSSAAAARELRLLAVHAHPDDETLTMGGTLAICADRGIGTCVVTCTDGQLGPNLDPGLSGATVRPRFGAIRRRELGAACDALGVGELRRLGYLDSGACGIDATGAARTAAWGCRPRHVARALAARGGELVHLRAWPRTFWHTDLHEVTGRLVHHIRSFRPQVVVTYDAAGGYGHPDHVHAHRATLLAVEAAAHPGMWPARGEPWQVTKLYSTAFAASRLRAADRLCEQLGLGTSYAATAPWEAGGAVDDSLVTTTVDGAAAVARRLRALRAHRSQIPPDFPLLVLPEELVREHLSREHFRLAWARVAVDLPESDLFAGLLR
jgi:LmbE family N-acetylglucosaminyl deacetylase